VKEFISTVSITTIKRAIMFASHLNHYNPGTSPVPYTFRKYLTMRVLAAAMFVISAVMGNVGGKDSQSQRPSIDKGIIGDLTVRYQDQSSCVNVTKPGARKKISLPISWQSAVPMVNNSKETFDDSSLIEYANHHGIGPLDSPTTLLLNTSSQSSVSSRSASSQSSSSSSNY
jgi:hypothetical protein